MKFMNEYDIDSAWHRHASNAHPNRLGATMVLDALREWTDNHSDGWPYWPKPARAAAGLMELAEPWNADHDVPLAALVAAAKPVKAFCTRQVREGNMTTEQRELILRQVS